MADEQDQRSGRPGFAPPTPDPAAGSVSESLMRYAEGALPVGRQAVATAAAGGAPERVASVPELMRRGVTAFQAGRLAQAEQAFADVLMGDPAEPTALQLLGVIAYRNGQGEDAVELIQAAVEIEPDYVEAHFNLGRVLTGLGRHAQAEARLNRVLELRPDYREAYLELANLLRRQGKLADALAVCRRLLTEDDSFPEAHLNTANLLAELNQSEQASRHYQRAISLRPGFALAHGNLGDLLKAQGALTAAVAEYRKAVDAAPGDRPLAMKLRAGLSELMPRGQFEMLRDSGRNDAYQGAIGRAVAAAGPAAVVLDIGAGTGLLAMMAARAGAERVYACEPVKPLAETAAEVVAENGLAGAVTVIAKASSDVGVGDDLPEPARLIIADPIDGGLLADDMIPALRHAIANLAAPGLRVIPAGATVYGMLVECPDLMSINPIGRISGFDLSAFDRFRDPSAERPFHLAVDPHRALTAHFEIARIDFAAPPAAEVTRALTAAACATGTGHAVVFWYDLHLDQETTLSTGPGAPQGHWGQSIRFLDRHLAVTAGDSLALIGVHGDTGFTFRAG